MPCFVCLPFVYHIICCIFYNVYRRKCVCSALALSWACVPCASVKACYSQNAGRVLRLLTVNTMLILNYFFQLDVGDRRGHDQKLSKKRFRLNVRKCAFSNRVTDNSCLLPCLPVALIVALLTLSRNTCRLNLNRKILYGKSLCLLMPASSVEAGVGEFGEITFALKQS